MTKSNKTSYEKLHKIYQKHRKKYKSNPDSKQMCCMWSTSNPPEVIEETEPFYEIENAFDITINDNDCMELYDMELDEAVIKIDALIQKKANIG